MDISDRPKLVFEAVRDQERTTRLQRLQASIARRPGVFLQAFDELGEAATSDSLDIEDSRIGTSDLAKDPKDRIKEYFTKRDDKVVEFDETTDDALFADPEYRRLLQQSRDLQSEKVKTGIMRSETRENPHAREARDAVRRYAFGFFLRRAVAWSQERPANNRLPSTG